MKTRYHLSLKLTCVTTDRDPNVRAHSSGAVPEVTEELTLINLHGSSKELAKLIALLNANIETVAAQEDRA